MARRTTAKLIHNSTSYLRECSHMCCSLCRAQLEPFHPVASRRRLRAVAGNRMLRHAEDEQLPNHREVNDERRG